MLLGPSALQERSTGGLRRWRWWWWWWLGGVVPGGAHLRAAHATASTSGSDRARGPSRLAAAATTAARPIPAPGRAAAWPAKSRGLQLGAGAEQQFPSQRRACAERVAAARGGHLCPLRSASHRAGPDRIGPEPGRRRRAEGDGAVTGAGGGAKRLAGQSGARERDPEPPGLP